jgi:hypothetical protein
VTGLGTIAPATKAAATASGTVTLTMKIARPKARARES